jgi:hypothetical protein
VARRARIDDNRRAAMTPFSIRHEFDASPDALWEVIVDEPYNQELYERAKVDRELLERRDEDGHRVVVARCTSRRKLPGFVEKLLGGPLGFTESLTIFDGAQRVEQRVEPSLFRERTEFRAELNVEALEGGRSARVFRGTLSIRLPVVGRRIERLTIRDMTQAQELAVKLARDRLARRGAGSAST